MAVKILVLDDAAHGADALARELLRAGFEVDFRRTASEEEYLAEVHALSARVVRAQDGKLGVDAGTGPLEVTLVTMGGGNNGREVESKRTRDLIDDAVSERLEQLHSGITQGLEQRRLREVNRRAVAALLESEQRYRTLAESSAVGIWHTDAEGRTLYVNPAMCALLEVDRAEDLAVKTFRDFFTPDSLDQVERDGSRAEGRTSWGSEIPILGARGGRRDVVCWSASLRNAEGIVTSHLRTFTDVTQFRQLQAQFYQAQKMEAIGRLAGGVAHDFNNLLTAVLTCCALLQRRLPEGDPGRTLLDEIENVVKRGASLTRQVLAFARQQLIETTVLDLDDVVTTIETLLRHLIGEDIELAVRLEPNLPRIRADRGQIEQILMNLAVNARDAMPRGGRLQIGTASIAIDGGSEVQRSLALDPGSYVCLTVSDTGCGMDDATKARIFEPFFTTKETGKGTGLGLATVFGIVRQARGGIEVDTEPGKGTTFRVYLPVTTEETNLQSPRDSIMRDARGTETILLVDDEESIRVPLAEFLRMRHYTVLEARNGEDALALAEKHAGVIDLLVTDVVMPKMGGRTLSESLKARHADLKVLYVSGYAEATIVRRGHLEPGAVLLQKPFTPEVLVSRVQALLGGGAPRR
jgi:PAS domain S-box-containing protein